MRLQAIYVALSILLLGVVGRPYLDQLHINSRTDFAINSSNSSFPSLAITDDTLSSFREATELAKPQHLPFRRVNGAAPGPRCYWVNHFTSKNIIIANLWTSEWYNQKKGEGKISNQRALQLLRGEEKGCDVFGGAKDWHEVQSPNHDVNMVTFNLGLFASSGCVGRAFRSASGLPDIGCHEHWSVDGILGLTFFVAGIVSILATTALALAPLIASGVAVSEAAGAGAAAAIEGAEIVEVEAAPAAAASVSGAANLAEDVGFVTQEAVGLASEQGLEYVAEVSPMVPWAETPTSLEAFPQLVTPASATGEGVQDLFASMDELVYKAQASANGMFRLPGYAIWDGVGRILSPETRLLAPRVASRLGLTQRGTKALVGNGKNIFQIRDEALRRVISPLDLNHKLAFKRDGNQTATGNHTASRNSARHARKGGGGRHRVSTKYQIFKTKIDHAPKEMQYGAIVGRDMVLGSRQELMHYIQSLG